MQQPEPWSWETPAARDFADAYRAQREAIFVATDRIAADMVVFGAAHPPLAERKAQYDSYWCGLERCFAGEWRALADSLALMGAFYQHSGARIDDWQRLAEAGTDLVHQELVGRHAGEPARLVASLQSMQRFFDRSYIVFNEAFAAAAQERLEQSDTLFRCLPVGMALMDDDSVILKANDAFATMYRLGEHALLGRQLASLFDPEHLSRARVAYTEEAYRLGRASYETVHVRANGELFPVLAEAVRVSPAGAPMIWAVSIHDLSERRQVEALRMRSAELETENIKVREASRVKTEFLANMSHELRTPLNSILGFSDLLRRGEVGELAPQQLEFIEDIHTSGRHLLRLISDVLDLAKVEAGKMTFDPEVADLEHVVREVVQITRGIASEKQQQIDVSVAPAAREVFLDVGRFKQVLYNYLSNAIKFSPVRGRIEVALAEEGALSFRLAVRDEGPGISPDDQDRLFAEFEQLEGGRSKAHGGTGLGLALVRRLVEAQGGSVGVWSQVGKGSTFHAVLARRIEAHAP